MVNAYKAVVVLNSSWSWDGAFVREEDDGDEQVKDMDVDLVVMSYNELSC